ncbi:MAG: type I-U CRISPR-associated protein Csb2 [Magnetococcus sp. DMHC-6]
MTAIGFRFVAGRYHATPWGRHVNEADVPWPPEPWRVLRAMLAVWHRKGDQVRFSEQVLERLIDRLAAVLPSYHLPAGVLAHTRHYMPGPKPADKDLIFDAFLRLSPSETLVMVWPGVELEEEEQALFSVLLENLGFLGRAEGWVEGFLMADWAGECNCTPMDAGSADVGGERQTQELFPLLVPLALVAYQKERAHHLDLLKSRKPAERKLVEKTLPEKLLDALRLDTWALRKAGWSAPPAAHFITYLRPQGLLRAQTNHRRRVTMCLKDQKEKILARFLMAGKPRPRMEEAVRVGEWTRQAVMGVAKRRLGERKIPPLLSGHDLPEGNRHGHTFFLPEDADGDGRVDHVLLLATDGFDGESLEVLEELRLVKGGDGQEWPVLLEGLATAQEGEKLSPWATSAAVWESVTPYLHPWHVKAGFGVAEQIGRECRLRGLAELVGLERLEEVVVWGRPLRPTHFFRFRSKKGLIQPDTHGNFLRLEFRQPVMGPLALGFGCHFGLGLFRPLERGEDK